MALTKADMAEKLFEDLGLNKREAKELVEAEGGEAASGVSSTVDYVVVGESPGSKFEKAKKLGLKIITEQEFKKLLK